jgi:hypothetical protein
MRENTARDELTMLILGKTAPRAADAILAAGYRKPRTITTAEELDALPVGSIVAMIGSEPDSPAVACRAVRGWQFLGDDPERRYLSSSLMPSAEPITVLFEPEASK